MAAAPSGQGYWQFTAAGYALAFGDAGDIPGAAASITPLVGGAVVPTRSLAVPFAPTGTGGLPATAPPPPPPPLPPPPPSHPSDDGVCNGKLPTSTTLDAHGQPGPAFLKGTPKDDVILGSAGDDVIDGGGGNDIICGGSGNDVIRGGDGNDAIVGAAGDDRLEGGDGNDTIVGGDGNDNVFGGNGVDYVGGGRDDDTLVGVDDEEGDRLDAGEGFDDCLFGGGDILVSCEY
jgi:Ca2+-binding RTX toxin-like protein